MTAFRRHDLAQAIYQAQFPLGPRESPNIDLFASAELCRFSSHCAHHYSTAQHSYFVVFLAVEEHQLTAIWLGMKNDYFLVSARLHKHRHIPESETLATAQENLDLPIQRLWQRWPVNFFSTCSQCFKHGGLIAQLRNKCRSINYQSRYSAINYHRQRSQAMKLHTFWLINLHYLTQVRKSMLQLQPSQCTIHCWQLVKINRPHGAEVFRSSKERLLLAPSFLLHGRYNHFPQLSSMLRNSNRLLKHQLVIFGLFPTLNSLIKHKENPTHKNSDNTANRLNPGRSIGATPSPRPYPAPQQHHKGRDQYAAQKMTRTQLDCDFLLKHGHPLAISDKRSMQTPRQMVQGETA